MLKKKKKKRKNLGNTPPGWSKILFSTPDFRYYLLDKVID